MQTTRAYAPDLPTPRAEVLLPLQEGRGAHQRLPPIGGKRRAGRGDSRKPSVRSPIAVNYRLRPYLSVNLHGRTLEALLDSGSERSFVNTTVVEIGRAAGDQITIKPTEAHLADGSPAHLPGSIRLPLIIGGQKYHHQFGILPNMETDIIIGIDLWARMNLRLEPRGHRAWHATMAATPAAGLQQPTATEEERLQTFLAEELPKFKQIQGPTGYTTHQIRLKAGTIPIKQRFRPRNPAMQAIIDREIKAMEQAGIIEPSDSAWSSPVVLVRKKDDSYRFCIDFRKLNTVTEKDAYPLPQIAATLDKLRGARYLSTLDLKQGYWQVPLTPDSRPLTAFTVPGRGLRQFRVMPFGLHSAPATFQRLLDRVIGPELEPHVLVYFDDIVIATTTFEEHLRILAEVFRRFRDARLRINTEKCQFGRKSLKYLGHIVDQQGLRTDPDKTRAITGWTPPNTVKQLRQFLGVASWYRRFVQNFSTVAAPLTRLTKKKVKWSWGQEQEDAFTKLQTALTSTLVLACPDFQRRFVLHTDASTVGLGAVLTQHQEDGERVIAYVSRTLNDAERNYSATELECLAVVWAIRRLRAYLEGYTFTVMTDHQALPWLRRLDNPTGRLGRWQFELQQWDFDIRYRKGSSNKVADALSRRPATTATHAPTRCPWYNRVKQQLRTQPGTQPDYEIRDGHVWRRILHSLDFNENPAAMQWKRCVPREERDAILRQHHDDLTAGHLGTSKTISRIAQRYYWPGMFQEVARYVRRCATCQQYKAEQQPKAGQLHATLVKQPWEQVAVDLVGPLPRSTNGYTWLLTIQDKFTKWLEIRPLRKATAGAVTRHIAEAVMYRYGRPAVLISDNGKQFISKQLTELLEQCGTRHQRTPPHAPQCNPVERTNRTIKTMIAQYTGRHHQRWDAHLAELQFAFNSVRHDATGYSPAYLNYGRELAVPGSPPTETTAAEEQPETRHRRLQEAYEVVRINLARAFQQQERPYNLRRRTWQPRVGQWVWIRLPLVPQTRCLQRQTGTAIQRTDGNKKDNFTGHC